MASIEIQSEELNSIRAGLIKADALFTANIARIDKVENSLTLMAGQYIDLFNTVNKLTFQVEQLLKAIESIKNLDRLSIEVVALREDFEEQQEEVEEIAKENRQFRRQIYIVTLTAAIGFVAAQYLPYVRFDRPAAHSQLLR